MIVQSELNIPRLLRRLGPPLASLFGYDIMVSVLYVEFHASWVAVGNLPLPLLGSALALFLGLRNNAAYARWWEARTLWGAVVNNSRSFARGALAVLTGDGRRELRTALVHHQIAWAHAVRLHLRAQEPWGELAPLLPPDTLARLRGAANVPAVLQGEVARLLAEALRAGALDGVRLTVLDHALSELANAQGGLERIKNTPMPRQYTQFLRVFIAAYCLLLPVSLVINLGLLTPVGSTVISFAFFALDQIGRDLEDPFENTIHDMPMSAITRMIEIDMRQMLGEAEVPPPLQPVGGVLW